MLQSLVTGNATSENSQQVPPSPSKSVERRASGPMMDSMRSDSFRSDGSSSYSGVGAFGNLDPAASGES